MNKLSILILTLFTISCQTRPSVYNKYAIDFNIDLMKIGHPTIDFSQTMFIETEEYKNKIGADALCSEKAIRTGGFVIIYISKNMNIYNETAARYIIYHEIGHCFFGKDHKDGDDLMSPMIGTLAMWNTNFNEQNRTKYVLQLVSY